MSKLREMTKGVTAMCVEAGAPFDVLPGGKHQKLIIHRGSQTRLVVYSSSPSDTYAVAQARRDVRRALKELGYAV
jgi:hypothetical protein